MKELFAQKFARKPDGMVKGDYFYRVPWLEAARERYDSEYSQEQLEHFEKQSKAKKGSCIVGTNAPLKVSMK